MNALLKNNGVFNELDVSYNRIGEMDVNDTNTGTKGLDGGELLSMLLRNRLNSRSGCTLTSLNVCTYVSL